MGRRIRLQNWDHVQVIVPTTSSQKQPSNTPLRHYRYPEPSWIRTCCSPSVRPDKTPYIKFPMCRPAGAHLLCFRYPGLPPEATIVTRLRALPFSSCKSPCVEVMCSSGQTFAGFVLCNPIGELMPVCQAEGHRIFLLLKRKSC